MHIYVQTHICAHTYICTYERSNAKKENETIYHMVEEKTAADPEGKAMVKSEALPDALVAVGSDRFGSLVIMCMYVCICVSVSLVCVCVCVGVYVCMYTYVSACSYGQIKGAV